MPAKSKGETPTGKFHRNFKLSKVANHLLIVESRRRKRLLRPRATQTAVLEECIVNQLSVKA